MEVKGEKKKRERWKKGVAVEGMEEERRHGKGQSFTAIFSAAATKAFSRM